MDVCLRAVVYVEYLILKRKKENKNTRRNKVEILHPCMNNEQKQKTT